MTDSSANKATNAKQLDSSASFEDIQSRLAFQEDTLSQLNRVVARQDEQIARLEQQLAALAGKYRDLRDTLDEHAEAPTDERPPHY